MRGTITKIKLEKSYHGGQFWWVFFKMEDGKSARACVYPHYRNYGRWEEPLALFNWGQEVILSGLEFSRRGKRLIDSDSVFKRVVKG